MRCVRCSAELKEGELVCPRCGYVSIEDHSSTASLNISNRLRRRTRDRRGDQDSPISEGIVLHIRGLQKRISLAELNNLIVGRADPVNGVYPDLDLAPYGAEQRGVSRHHLRLHYADGLLTATDLNSANGTQVNGVRLLAGQSQELKDGDELTLGQLSIGISYLR